jgi:hypothetical protein
MKNLTLTLMGMTALAMGCKDKDCADTAGGCDTGAEMEEEASFNIAWTDGASTLEASVSNPHVDGYFLGLAETGSGDSGWYGEDCVSDDAQCHDMGASSTLSLESVSAIADVVPGSTTLFSTGLWAGVTYAFFSNEGAGDYDNVAHSGGDDTSYYE